MAVELVDEQRALELARDAYPAEQLFALHELAGRVARVGEQQRGESTALHFAAQIVRGEGVSALSFQQDGDCRESAEDVEQLLVRGVVGEEVPEVDVPERCSRARERGAPAAGDGDVFRAVL